MSEVNEQQDSEAELLEISSISNGALVFAFGMIFRSIVSAGINALLTRGLGASMYGTYSYARTITKLSQAIGKLGSSESILRFIPEYHDTPKRQNRILGLALVTSLVGSLLVAGALYFFAPLINDLSLKNGTLTTALRYFIFVLPFGVLISVIANIFRGIERPQYQIGILKILYPLTQLIAVIVALILGYALFGVISGLIISGALVLLVSGVLLYRKSSLRPKVRLNKKEAYEYYDYSIPLTLTAAGSLLYSRVDVLMVGYFLADTDVGVYSIAVLVASFIGMPLSGLNQLFPPIASRLHNEDEKQILNNIFAMVTRWAFTFSLVLAISGITYREEILRIFGEEFPAGAIVLVLFVVAQIIRSAVGPSGYMLMMTGHQYLSMINRWVLGVLNVVLNVVFILRFGLIGAALGSATSLAVVNLLRVIEIYHFEGYFPYTRNYYKPIVAVCFAIIPMWGATFVLEGIRLVVVGSIFGGCLYLIVLYMLGIEDLERKLLQKALASLRT